MCNSRLAIFKLKDAYNDDDNDANDVDVDDDDADNVDDYLPQNKIR